VNFAEVSGDQFFTVCPLSTPTAPGTWGGLKSIYR